LGRITAMGLEGVTFDDGLLDEVATILRGNARAAQKIAINITNYLAPKGLTHFGYTDWEELKYQLGILPLGLSRIELQILRILTQKKECSLTNLAAKTGLTVQCIRQDFEMYLQKQNLMDITTAGRSITIDGLNYIENVRKLEALDKA
jgi:Holliday junction resolvasome RuvABC ATP-dependent DNA helicase subunit